MNSPDPSLDRIIRLARSSAPAPAQEDEPLPPGLATRIAANWSAAPPEGSARLWERLGYAGLAASLAVAACSFGLRQRPHSASAAPPADEITLADLLDAHFDPDSDS